MSGFFTKSTLEWQSLSKVKMGKGSTICRKLQQQIRIVFINVKFFRFEIFHHPNYIIKRFGNSGSTSAQETKWKYFYP